MAWLSPRRPRRRDYRHHRSHHHLPYVCRNIPVLIVGFGHLEGGWMYGYTWKTETNLQTTLQTNLQTKVYIKMQRGMRLADRLLPS